MRSIDYEDVKCNNCNEDRTELLFMAKNMFSKMDEQFSVVKCLKCGLIYLNPRPSKDAISKYYINEYTPHLSKENILRTLSLNIYNKLFYSPILELEHHIFGRVLDVGCGGGKLLEKLDKKGWDTYGIDVSSKAVKNANERGLHVQKGELHEMNFPQKFFDVIIMRHSLEHMHDPLREIETAYNILKERGILFIEVPNVNCFEAQFFRENWLQIDAPRHLYHFTEKTLTRLLIKAGFCINRVNHVAIPFSTISQSINYRTGLKFKWLFQNPFIAAPFYPISVFETKILHQGPSIVVEANRKECISK